MNIFSGETEVLAPLATGWFLENDVQPRGPQATIPHFEFKKTNET